MIWAWIQYPGIFVTFEIFGFLELDNKKQENILICVNLFALQFIIGQNSNFDNSSQMEKNWIFLPNFWTSLGTFFSPHFFEKWFINFPVLKFLLFLYFCQGKWINFPKKFCFYVFYAVFSVSKENFQTKIRCNIWCPT